MTQCTMCQCVQLLHMIDTDYSLYSTCIYISFRFKSVILGVYRPLFHYISRRTPPHSAYPPWLITVSLTSHFSHERTVASYIWVNFRSANSIFTPLEFWALVPCPWIPHVSVFVCYQNKLYYMDVLLTTGVPYLAMLNWFWRGSSTEAGHNLCMPVTNSGSWSLRLQGCPSGVVWCTTTEHQLPWCTKEILMIMYHIVLCHTTV